MSSVQENDFLPVSSVEKDFRYALDYDFMQVEDDDLFCTVCNASLIQSIKKTKLAYCHPVLNVLLCQNCYVSGLSSNECLWCNGHSSKNRKLYACLYCTEVFCEGCVTLNFGRNEVEKIALLKEWKCFKCDLEKLWFLRAKCEAGVEYSKYLTCESMNDTKKECSVCMDAMEITEVIERLNCSHTFHKKCIDMWKARQRTCPLCREGFGTPRFSPYHID